MAASSLKVCVIGAGASGIAACKVLQQHGIAFTCYEAGDRVGGNWVYENTNGMSSAYRSLHINSCRANMQYSDFPVPEHYPEFPHHSQIASYFESYAEHFGIKRHIRFRTRVLSCEPVSGGGWEVTSDDGQKALYRAVLVANGHHWSPHWPQPPFSGTFSGKVMHSHDYRTPEDLEDKRVLIVGFGNSAMDIAVELSRIAPRTILSVRRGFHVVPKRICGRTSDQRSEVSLPRRVLRRVRRLVPGLRTTPAWLDRFMLRTMVRLQQGDVSAYGLPQPDHKLLHAHPTISSELLDRLAHGSIQVRPNIQSLDGDHVVFNDGSREPVDVIIFCTGYRIDFPFFRPELISAPNNELPLYGRVFHPDYPDLLFIGLLQPLGSVIPLAELQSEWVADYLCGECGLPGAKEMQTAIRREREAVRKRYGNAPRHTMQVDVGPYTAMVMQERKRGAARARQQTAAEAGLVKASVTASNS
jgi:cation diffusion facilitator CzcD-associated flavoprotein CzcO